MQETKTNGVPAPTEASIVTGNQAPLATQQFDESVEQKLARAERSIQFRKGILKLIAANINPTDIVLFGKEGEENLHLAKTACKQILSWAGAKLEMDSCIQEKKYDGPEGPYLDFEAWGTVITGDGRAVRVMGNRSTYDDFYAQRTRYVCSKCKALTSYDHGCPEHGKVQTVKEVYYLPITEVDIPAIKQAAITNLWNHAVEDLGFKPSLDELRGAGLDLKSQKRVDFKKGGKNAPAASNTQQAAKPAAQTAKTEAPKHATTAGGVPKANIPKGDPAQAAAPATEELPLGEGIIAEASMGTTKEKRPYVRILQNGFWLFCYHDSDVETAEGPKNKLQLILHSKGQYCKFVVTTKGEYNYIEGGARIGKYEWDADGNPKPLRTGWASSKASKPKAAAAKSDADEDLPDIFNEQTEP